MKTMPQDDRVSKFVAAITKEAEEQRAQIEAETKAYIATEMENAELEALNDSYKLIQRAVTVIRSDIGSELSANLMDGRKSLLTRRSEITEHVLQQVAEKIKTFTESTAYADFLKKSAEQAAPVFKGGAVIVWIREKDIEYSSLLKAVIPNCEFRTDNTIELGGIAIVDSAGKLRVDDTLDTRLEYGRDWFTKNSGLTLS